MVSAVADFLVEAVEVIEVCGVALDADGVGADGGHRSGESVLLAGGDVDACAFDGESFGGGQADAGVGAGDECDFVVESLSWSRPVMALPFGARAGSRDLARRSGGF